MRINEKNKNNNSERFYFEKDVPGIDDPDIK